VEIPPGIGIIADWYNAVVRGADGCPVAIEVFDDADKRRPKRCVVAQAQRSMAAIKKQTISVTPDGLPVQDFTRCWPVWRR
jgi:hypothetical protein